MYRLGIDIGSKTIKIALVDDDGKLVYADYQRHRSKIRDGLLSIIHMCIWKAGDHQVEVTVSGSAGLHIAELFDVPFVQEVVALKTAVQQLVPDADVILEMGGEDTKLVYLTGTPEQRMNTICAGGTGGFIDTMASLMGVEVEDMESLAAGHTSIHPIASRCAVFAKSDVRPLINAGVRNESIAMSVLEAVCTQAVAGLSAGRPLEGKVVLLGGPFHYTPVMRQAFCKVTGISEADAVIPENAHLFVARGAAAAREKTESIALTELEALIENTDFSSDEGLRRLPPLFYTQEDYEAFQQRHAQCRIPRASTFDTDDESLFIGIDAGSTTMKVALVDINGSLCAYEYDWNEGDITESLPWMLKELYHHFGRDWTRKKILRRSCVVGYGEEFCRRAYLVDTGQVETVAHLRAARELESDVDFLLDIGGQDIKCFYIEDGAIADIVLNEACSSGCGSLFDSVARSMSMAKESLAGESLFAGAPVDLGTRCSVFMDSRVKHAQKEGATAGDIGAGIAYSTARNALFKVVRQPDFKKVGKHIVVQGGAFANDALLRAFELETGAEVRRPDLSKIMGAWGAALLARDEWLALRERDPEAADRVVSTLLTAEQLEDLSVRKHGTRCDLCENRCSLSVVDFTGGEKDPRNAGAWHGWYVPEREPGALPPVRTLVMGNRCERGAMAHGAAVSTHATPPNLVKLKHALIEACDRTDRERDDRPHDVEAPGAPVIGIPKALALYESYPFWHALFTELGFDVASNRSSDEAVFRKGMGLIPSEGACYPSKLLFGQCVDIIEQGAHFIFAPDMTQALARYGLLGLEWNAALHDCPLIENMGTILRDNPPQRTGDGGLTVLAPDLLEARTLDDVASALHATLKKAGLPCGREDLDRAVEVARNTYRDFLAKLDHACGRALARVDAGEFPGALMAQHPYHADPGIGHGIDEQLAQLGYAVFERSDYLPDSGIGSETPGHPADARIWYPNDDLARRCAAGEDHPGMQFIICRSFGCGIDALAADDIHEHLRADGRNFAEVKLDQIVDIAAVRIRLRSLAYTAAQRTGHANTAGAGMGPAFSFMSSDAHANLEHERSTEQFYRAEQRKLSKHLKRVLAPYHIHEGSGETDDDEPQDAQSDDATMVRTEGGGGPLRGAPIPRTPDAPSITEPVLLQEAMRNLGYYYRVIPSGAFGRPTCSILFEGHNTSLSFETWDDVSAYIAERHEKVMRSQRDSAGFSMKRLSTLPQEHEEIGDGLDHMGQIEAMKRLGFDLTADYTGIENNEHYLRSLFFDRESGSISFADWDEVDAYLAAHSSSDDAEVVQNRDVRKPGER